MRPAVLLIAIVCGLFLPGCASQDPEQVQLGPSIKEQRQDARQKEEFARSLPPPRP